MLIPLTEKDLSMLPIIIADVDVESSLVDMCKQADILLNCVGPVRIFFLYLDMQFKMLLARNIVCVKNHLVCSV